MTNPAFLSAIAKGDLVNALAAATPGGIEAQEARGQRDMASSFVTLPAEMNREIGEAFGFVYGEPVDELFVSVTAPAGWSIRPTDHSMHSDILDDQGRVRGSIFYKAAFYDRRADGHWSQRYKAQSNYGDDGVTSVDVNDAATGESLWHAEVPESDLPRWDRPKATEAAGIAWLAEHFPDHASPLAYW